MVLHLPWAFSRPILPTFGTSSVTSARFLRDYSLFLHGRVIMPEILPLLKFLEAILKVPVIVRCAEAFRTMLGRL